MSAFVVDTNVPVAANGRAEQADGPCVVACIDALERIKNYGTVVLDDAFLILGEYVNNLSMSGQPGPGDAFMKWVWNIQAVETRCERVPITPRNGGYAEFPDCENLAGFDPSDRKFVAVALTSRHNPVVLNAVDSDWRDYQQALEAAGVRIEQLCPDCLRDRE